MKLYKKYLKEGFSFSNLTTDVEILRTAIIAEYEAVNLYEHMSEISSNSKVKKTLLDISNEEKIHIGEFKYLLEILDKDHKNFLKKGEKEVKQDKR